MSDTESSLQIITASELATYVVCPEAWRLKREGNAAGKRIYPQNEFAAQLKKEWIEQQDLSTKLCRYAKTTYLLFVGVVIIVFLWEQQRTAAVLNRGINPQVEKMSAE